MPVTLRLLLGAVLLSIAGAGIATDSVSIVTILCGFAAVAVLRPILVASRREADRKRVRR